MILSGAELLSLQSQHGYTQGRRAKSDTTERPFAKWEDFIAHHSDGELTKSTAWRYMDLARAAKRHIPALADSQVARFELTTAGEQDALFKAVSKHVDGKTVAEAFADFGITKKPRGSGVKGGKKVATDDDKSAKKQTPQETAAESARLLIAVPVADLDEARANPKAFTQALYDLDIDILEQVASTLKVTLEDITKALKKRRS